MVCMVTFHNHLTGYLDLSVGSIVSWQLAHSLMFKMKEHFSKIEPLVIFFLGKSISDVSILLMIPLPFAKSCEVDERIRGQNLFNGLGEEKPETIPTV